MTVYKNLAKFVREVEDREGLLKIEYTRPDYQDPEKKFTVGQWTEKLSQTAIDKFVDLKPGDLFCLHVEKGEAGYLNIKDITDKEDAPEKKTQNSQYKKGGKRGYSGDGGVGAQIGNALNVAAITLGPKSTIEQIKQRAKEIIEVGEELKKELVAMQKTSGTANTEAKPDKLAEARARKAAQAKKEEPTKELEDIAEQEDLVDDDLESLKDWS